MIKKTILVVLGIFVVVGVAVYVVTTAQSQNQRDENYKFAQDTLRATHEVEQGKTIFNALVAEHSIEKLAAGIPTVSAHVQTAHTYIEPWLTNQRSDIRQYAITYSNGLNNLDKTYSVIKDQMATGNPSVATIQVAVAANVAAQHELFNTMSQILVGLSLSKEQRDSLANDLQSLADSVN